MANKNNRVVTDGHSGGENSDKEGARGGGVKVGADRKLLDFIKSRDKKNGKKEIEQIRTADTNYAGHLIGVKMKVVLFYILCLITIL